MRFKIFDSYFLVINPSNSHITIVSVKRRTEKVLKPTIRSGMSYFRLYENGASREFSLNTLVLKIETFTSVTQLSHEKSIFPKGLID